MSNIKNIRREVHDYPRYYQAYLRLIHRIRSLKRISAEGDVWQDLTDEQVFWAWANKMGPNKALAERQQLTIQF